ncbi:MAG: ABC transporter substrate-binding protein [Chloroflexi bacterium]|nr:ABC transporter substrate-binding protein [Chloroflexota bacterium]
MSRWSWALSGMVAVLLLACAPAPQAPARQAAPQEDKPIAGGVFIKWLGGDPPTFDNHQSNTYQTNEPFHPAYNGLVRYDPNDPIHEKIQPSLAERWELSKDGLTFTFNLQKGVKFHDGGSWDAHDAKYNLERMKDPPKGVISPRRGAFEPVERIEVADDYTLKVQMKRPYPSFIPNIAQGWMVMYDKQWMEAGHDPTKEVNGTGPFKFKEYIRGTSIEMVKNTGYWKQGYPYLDGVKFFIIPDRGTSVAAFRTGQIHFYRPDAGDAKTLVKELGDKVKMTDTFGWGGTFINLSVLRKPFDDVRVRQALSLAINREEAIKIISDGDAYVQGFMPGKGAWALSKEELAKLPGYGPDMDKRRAEAKKLLADAGYANGFEAKLGVRKVAGAEDAAIYVKDQFAKIGVNISLDIQETATAYTNMEQATFDMFIWGTAYALDDPDAVYNEHYLCTAPRNYSRVCAKDVDALYEKQTRATDPAERKKLVQEMERLAIPQVHKIIVQGSQSKWGMWSFVRDYTPQASIYSNSHLEGVWLAKQ